MINGNQFSKYLEANKKSLGIPIMLRLENTEKMMEALQMHMKLRIINNKLKNINVM